MEEHRNKISEIPFNVGSRNSVLKQLNFQK